MPELPIPPDEVILTSVGKADKKLYLAGGLADRNYVLSFLQTAGLDTSKGKWKILDWGSGSGRVARHWESLSANVDLFGCDVREEPVRWCQENLSFGNFSVSAHNPPLNYPDGHFDAIYGLSVFTHLSFKSHYLWMAELWRLLKPNGVVVLTVHGPTILPIMLTSIANKAAEKVEVDLVDEQAFLYVDRGQGLNHTGNVVPFGVFSKIFHPFIILEHKPRHGLMGIHDSYLLRKKISNRLTVIEDFLDVKMTGRNFHSEAKLDFNGENCFCILAAARDLVRPATIQLSLRPMGSDKPFALSKPVDLPLRAHWTPLHKSARINNAFSSLIIENIPQVNGPVIVSLDVTGSEQLNGSQVLLKQAMLF